MFNKEEVLKEMIQIIKKSYELNCYFEYDLIQDGLLFDELKAFDLSFIWVLRENGTVLVPLYRGFNPSLITYIAKKRGNRFFLIKSNGEITQIEAAKAVELISIPPFRVTAYSDDALAAQVTKLLSTPRLNSSVFTCNHLKFDDFTGWHDWFVSNKNNLMAGLMAQVVTRLS